MPKISANGAVRFLDVAATAQMVGLSSATVRRWADRGVIPSFRLPNGYRRFERASVEAWMRENNMPQA